MAILITGGAGYIGSHVNKLLSQNGFDTIIFDNLSTGSLELVRWGKFILGDLSNVEQLDLLFQKNKIDAVMHFAASAYVGESVIYPHKYYANNLANTINLLHAMKKYEVRRLVFSSSCAVYGNPMQSPIDEQHPQMPINPYGASKFMVERILSDYSHADNFEYISLRYFNAAGADLDGEIGEMHEPETHIIPLALKAAFELSDEFKIYGADYPTSDGTCIRDYIHVSDLAKAHFLALEYLISGGKSNVFNLSNGRGYSVRAVLNAVMDVTGRTFSISEFARRAGDPPELVGNSDKFRHLLNWKPECDDLHSMVETAWNWHKSKNFRHI